MKKRIMILGASILQLPAIQKAKEMGLEVIAVDMNPNAIGFQEADICVVESTIDIDAVACAAKKHNIDGILTIASDMPMRTVATVSRALNLVGIDMETAIKATNKAEMRKALRDYAVPIPVFYSVSTMNEYMEVIRNFNKPFIVKPVDNSGSRGIYKLMPNAHEKILREAYLYSHRFSRTGDVIVEEFMDGEEVSVETLSVNGTCHVIQITDKLTTGAPHFVEIGHSQPTHHSKETIEKIKEVAMAANHAIGIKDGPSHTEIMVTKEGPKVVELGARLGGDCITSHLVPLSTGIDMVECCIKIALGEEIDIQPKFSKSSAIRFLPQKPGVIKSIEEVESAKQITGIKQISILYNVGDKLNIIDSSASRLGFVIAQAETTSDCIKRCERAIATMNINIVN